MSNVYLWSWTLECQHQLSMVTLRKFLQEAHTKQSNIIFKTYSGEQLKVDDGYDG